MRIGVVFPTNEFGNDPVAIRAFTQAHRGAIADPDRTHRPRSAGRERTVRAMREQAPLPRSSEPRGAWAQADARRGDRAARAAVRRRSSHSCQTTTIGAALKIDE